MTIASTHDRVVALFDGGMIPADIARTVGISKQAVSQHLEKAQRDPWSRRVHKARMSQRKRKQNAQRAMREKQRRKDQEIASFAEMWNRGATVSDIMSALGYTNAGSVYLRANRLRTTHPHLFPRRREDSEEGCIPRDMRTHANYKKRLTCVKALFDHGTSVPDIAATLSMSRASVYTYLKALGEDVRRDIHQRNERIVQRFLQGERAEDIAHSYDMTCQNLYRIIMEYGVSSMSVRRDRAAAKARERLASKMQKKADKKARVEALCARIIEYMATGMTIADVASHLQMSIMSTNRYLRMIRSQNPHTIPYRKPPRRRPSA
jgi:DNA-binding CsgD family transcriptional regulator